LVRLDNISVSGLHGWQPLESSLVVEHSEGLLFHVVAALHTAGSFTGRLDSRKQQAYQNTDDRDDHQKLNEGKATRRSLAHDNDP
jgi:hypothetical protein